MEHPISHSDIRLAAAKDAGRPARPSPPAPDAGLHQASGYRPELHGLRGLAVALVVLYHVWLGRVSGGVDVFFLISGFLITGQLYRAGQRGGIGFGRFWGRLLRRLVPTAMTVLLVTVVASVLLLGQTRWVQTIREVLASALYLENWQLAADSVNYSAASDAASVVQHFWSLSIQGQFYLLWPVLVAAVVLIAGSGRLRSALTVTLLAVFTASLSYSVFLTADNQPLAYFHTFARIWEFALGGLLALSIDRITLPSATRVVLGWIGVAGLMSCGLVLDAGTVFPGYLALWPTLAAVAVILAGTTGGRRAADRWLSTRPLTYLGDISYSLYLWHWPVLILFLHVTAESRASFEAGALVIAGSVLLAAVTYHLVEKRFRSTRDDTTGGWRGWRAVVVATTSVLVAVGAWQLVSMPKDADPTPKGDLDHPGALALRPGFSYAGAPDATLEPPMIAIAGDWAVVGEDCRTSARNDELQICSTLSDGDPLRRVVVVGDSHAGQYVAALRPIAERRNWRITAILKGACPFSTDSDGYPGEQSCLDWNAAAVAEIVELRPDAVLTIATRDVRVGLTEYTPQGFVQQWRALDEAGIPVLAVRDNPRFDYSPPECVQTFGRGALACDVPRAELFAAEPPYRRLIDTPPNVTFLDFSDSMCVRSSCPPEIGNVLVYMDDNHLSATYQASMADFVEQAISSALGWQYDS